jgi:hypothetical protein
MEEWRMKKLMVTMILALVLLVGCGPVKIADQVDRQKKGRIVVKGQAIYQMEEEDTFNFSAEETHLRLLTATVFEGTEKYLWIGGIHEWLGFAHWIVRSPKYFSLGTRMSFVYTGPAGISVGILPAFTPDYIVVEFEELGPQKTFVTLRATKPIATDPLIDKKHLKEIKEAIYLAILGTTPKTYEECMDRFEEMVSAAEARERELEKKLEEESSGH